MYGCSLVLNGLNDGVYIDLVKKKLVVSSRYTQNLPISVNRSVHSTDCTELVITVQSDTSNSSKSDKLGHSIDRIWSTEFHRDQI